MLDHDPLVAVPEAAAAELHRARASSEGSQRSSPARRVSLEARALVALVRAGVFGVAPRG